MDSGVAPNLLIVLFSRVILCLEQINYFSRFYLKMYKLNTKIHSQTKFQVKVELLFPSKFIDFEMYFSILLRIHLELISIIPKISFHLLIVNESVSLNYAKMVHSFGVDTQSTSLVLSLSL